MFSAPEIALCSPASSRERYSFFASARYRMSLTRVDLPDPETPVTTVITPSGKVTSRFLRLFSFAPRMVSAVAIGVRGAPARISIESAPRCTRRSRSPRLAHDFLRRSMRDQTPAMPARSRAKIDHIIGAANGFFIMLDDQNRIAQDRADSSRAFSKPVIIAMMQSDRRLVQHI